jgi:hypothetical protein
MSKTLQDTRKEQNYFFGAAYTIYIRFLIANLCLQHSGFTNTACLCSKDTALENVFFITKASGGCGENFVKVGDDLGAER